MKLWNSSDSPCYIMGGVRMLFRANGKHDIEFAHHKNPNILVKQTTLANGKQWTMERVNNN